MQQYLLSVLLLLSLSVSNYTHAQNYTLLGSAATYGTGCDCFRITPNAENQAGAIFQNQTINLNNSFDFTFSVFFGCNNGSGADGLMFVLTSNPNGLGNPGEGLGYAGSNQPFSLAVEFDTYQNGSVNDPGFAHIAINSGGLYNHNVSSPVQASSNSGVIDDCQSHTVRIVWDVNTNTYSVYFDGVLRTSIVIPNIVSTYFGGNPIVNWGWSAATGGGTNDQRVCVESTSNWVAGVNYQSCSPTLQFSDISTSNLGSVQSWAWTFGDGGTSNLQNPSHTYAGIGTYNVTLVITDQSSCTNSYTRPVTIAAPISLSATPTPPPCNGGTNGSISLVPTGGFGPAAGYGGYQYNWSTGFQTQNAVGIGAGTYTVTVTDGVCTTTGQYTLNQPSPLTATVSKTDANCGQNNGTASIVLTGGTTPYSQVNWGGGFVGTTVTGLAPGVRIADFTDANGCSSLQQYSVTIGSLPCGITSSISKTDVTCFGLSNGSATLTVNGATGTPNITWSPGGQTGATASNLAAGTYTYNYSDADPNHAFSGTITISQPTAPMLVSLTTLNTSCTGINDGQAIASVTSGGNTPYNYAWSGGQPNTPSVSNLAPGNISVIVTDGRGCTATANGIVSAPPTLTVNITTIDDSCYQGGKGQATANVNGGNPPYTYYWNNISTAQTNLDLSAGSYLLTVTDNKGCTVTGSTSINEPTNITYTITPTPVNCFGDATGSIMVNPSGGSPGYSYSWNPANATGNNPANLTSGKYIVTITDSKLCSKVDSTVISQPTAPLNVVTSSTNVTCNGLNNGTITITVSGGTLPYSFLGNAVPPGTNTITGLSPNTYAGNLTDGNGCTFQVSEIITEPAVFVINKSKNNVSCNGGNNGNIDIAVSGGTAPYSFLWADGIVTEDRTGIQAGIYSVTATDANGCTVRISDTITEPPLLTVNETHINVACNGNNTGSIDITVSGGSPGYTFAWADGPTTEDRNNINAGSYTLVVTDTNLCTAGVTVTITEPSALVATETHTNVTCNGLANGTITLTANGGSPPYSFLGNPVPQGTNTISNLPPNTYAGNLSDANGCNVPLSVTITEPTALTISATPTNAICNGSPTGAIDVTTSGGTTTYTFVWNDAITTEDRNAIVAGNYTITATDANQCTITLNISVTEPAPIPLSVTTIDASCYGGTGSATANPSGGTLPYTYIWSSGGSGQTTSPLAGNHSVTVSDANQCRQIATFTIGEPTEINIQPTTTNPSCFGSSDGTILLNISGGTGTTYTFNWSMGGTSNNFASMLSAGTYYVSATDANNCLTIDTILLTEPNQLTPVATPTPVTCFGDINGTITVVTTGGTGAYNYTASDGSNSYNSINGNFSNLAAGNYTILVTDQNQCTAQTNTIIITPTQLQTNTVVTDVSCYEYSDGTITFSSFGGSPGYNYNLLGVSSNSTGVFASLPVGNYNYLVTDAANCSISGTITITQPDSVIISVSPSPATVSLGNTLSLLATTNQTTGVTYTWSPATDLSCSDCDNPVFAGLNSITYSVSATTTNGCVGTTTVQLSVEPNYDLFVPNAFSPNNDGGNDIWNIYGNTKGIKQFEVKVFNRWGEKVFESTDVNFGWDGYFNGSLVDQGVYTYIVKIVWINNHTSPTRKGSLTVIR